MPMWMFSEEVQESRNKDTRNYREFHAQKFTRKENVEDIVNMLLVFSDPVITSMRRTKKKRNDGNLPKSVIALLEVLEEVQS